MPFSTDVTNVSLFKDSKERKKVNNVEPTLLVNLTCTFVGYALGKAFDM